ncbi:MAG TPA: AraC family transcriptional regulator [Kiritimatiellia bacterium]|nr:AraC family transcriptional regulator [Kiritimatiellia bacterium]HPS07645.1 AraC family transcriptional regulator [Kiritimatiellia bacterium]
MSKPVCTLPFEYVDTPERRVLNLEHEGLPCIPALGYSHFKSSKPSVSEHIHPGCLEVSLCMRGSLIFEFGGNALQLLPGNVLVTQPDEWHRLSTNPKGLVMYWMFFRLEPENRPVLHLPPAESDILKQTLRTLPRRLFKGSDRLRLAFQRLFKLHIEQAPGAFRRLAMRGAVLDLLLALIEAAQAEPKNPGDLRIARIIDTMRQHPEREYPIDLLTRDAALSESRLNTRFKQLTGLPPYTFLLACRMRAAQQRLRATDEPVTAIAQALGFSSSQHFAMQFKREFGLTPSAWRSGQSAVTRPSSQEECDAVR